MRSYLNRPPESWSNCIETLQQTKFFLVSRIGPLLFVLRADNDPSETVFKVWIGTPYHRCSCGGGEALGKLCLHVCFVIIKILKVPSTNPLSWQLALGEEDIDQILTRKHRLNSINTGNSSIQRHPFLRRGDAKGRLKSNLDSNASAGTALSQCEPINSVTRKELEENDTCAICQDSMTNVDLINNVLCYCKAGCGSNFHVKCFRILQAHTRSEKRQITCPLCRCQWVNSIDYNGSLNKANGIVQAVNRKRLPLLKCHFCRMTVRDNFVRCAVCPSVDACVNCFDGGSAHKTHDSTHPWVMAGVREYPAKWSAVFPKMSHRIPFDGDTLSLLQYRDITPTDYYDLLALDHSSSNSVPLYMHLASALLEVPTVGYSEQNCIHCSIPLSVDKTVRQFPCPSMHIVHSSCAISIILSALSVSECQGSIAGSIRCPYCPQDDYRSKSTLLFPSLQREPVESNMSEDLRPNKRTPDDKLDVHKSSKETSLSTKRSLRSEFSQLLILGVNNHKTTAKEIDFMTMVSSHHIKKDGHDVNLKSNHETKLKVNNLPVADVPPLLGTSLLTRKQIPQKLNKQQ